MERNKKIIVVIDTNLWISFLIGKRTANLISLLSRPNIALAISEEAMEELRLVTGRGKFRKYFPKSYAHKVIDFILSRAMTYKLKDIPNVCRDPKDNYLLALSDVAKADYLITGDQDLLVLEEYKDTVVLTLSDFFVAEG